MTGSSRGDRAVAPCAGDPDERPLALSPALRSSSPASWRGGGCASSELPPPAAMLLSRLQLRSHARSWDPERRGGWGGAGRTRATEGSSLGSMRPPDPARAWEHCTRAYGSQAGQLPRGEGAQGTAQACLQGECYQRP